MLLRKKKKENVCEAVPFIYGLSRRGGYSYRQRMKYRKNATHLENFQASREIILYSNSLTHGMCDDLRGYLRSLRLLETTISAYLSDIFGYFSAMRRAGYAVNEDYRSFRLIKEEVVTVALSSTEIERIHVIKPRDKSVEIIRDLFVIGCLTGLRYSDFSTLGSSNIKGSIIVKKTKKTGALVEIPMHPIVKTIIEKYGGFPPYRDSAQNFNKVVKTLCKRAGLTDKVFIERTRGGVIERFSRPRYQMVSSHTARRSFSTNAYLAGIPTARIMLITGHKTEAAFFRYIRIGRAENARTLLEHPFFR